MKTQLKSVSFVLAMITLLAASWNATAVAQDPETITITFVLDVHHQDLSDENGDGIPELPTLTGNELVGVVFKRSEETAVSTLTFADDSPPCGPFDIKGTSWSGPSPAMLVGKKGPTGADCFGNVLYPPERGFLQASKVTEAHACWYKIVSDHLYPQTEYDGYTAGAIIIMTGEFRLSDLF